MINHFKKNTGFTLMELIVTVAVAGILLSIGVPSFNSTIRSNRLTSHTNSLIIALHFSRGESVKRNKSITIRRKSPQWESGWNVFIDVNGDGNKDNGDELIKTYPSLPPLFTLRSSDHFITFTSQGFVKSESITTFKMCVDAKTSDEYARTVRVNAIGRPHFEKGVSSC